MTRISDRSAIEWTDATWNPVTGCTKVSPGCAHCYAETFAERFRGVPGHPYEQGFDLRFWPGRLEAPLSWREPRRIFVNSMSDLFHEAIPESYIASVFAVMAKASWHQFQVLTKRHERLAELAPRLSWPENRVGRRIHREQPLDDPCRLPPTSACGRPFRVGRTVAGSIGRSTTRRDRLADCRAVRSRRSVSSTAAARSRGTRNVLISPARSAASARR